MLGETSIASKSTTKKFNFADKFLSWHSWVLLGYAICGRGFSYVGIPPAYIGEITLLFGLVTLSINKSIPKILKLPQTWFLLLFMLWCCINTIPYFPIYGLDTIRDAALWYYCFFALIIATLLVGKPQRFLFMVSQYERFSKIFVILMPFVWAISKNVTLPIVPGSSMQIITLKPADTMTHFSAITAFFIGSNLLKFQTTFFILTFLINLAVVAINANRAGMLAFLNAFALVSISKYKSGKIWKILTILIFIILLILFMNPEIFEPIFSKIASIFVDNQERQGTKNYRLDWWNYIINYTIFGDYFWTGKGFGINLGVDSGFDPLGDGNVRSPHNGHISVLARTGVPGLVLWLLVQLSWAGTILLKFRQSRMKGQTKWAGVFLTLLAFWIASMTVTTFEVIIEGPTGGIWLWTMYGVGLAAIKLHKTHPEILT
ncbi:MULTISPECIES: O-antigen ligase family protein [unclassified Anabaena]|uniref:O-antigen ligase family protein n=1 Tax=unclassified Anabaena TaxID=2619674 RepID=UPI0039C641F8